TEIEPGDENTGQSLVTPPHRQLHFVSALPVQKLHSQSVLGTRSVTSRKGNRYAVTKIYRELGAPAVRVRDVARSVGPSVESAHLTNCLRIFLQMLVLARYNRHWSIHLP